MHDFEPGACVHAEGEACDNRGSESVRRYRYDCRAWGCRRCRHRPEGDYCEKTRKNLICIPRYSVRYCSSRLDVTMTCILFMIYESIWLKRASTVLPDGGPKTFG